MALPVFIAAAGTISSSLPTLTGLLGGNPKDAERLTANNQAYQAALAGDDNALLFLKQRTGKYGIAIVPGYGSVGGWATDVAKTDANVKYEAALAQRRGAAVIEEGQSTLGKIGDKLSGAVNEAAAGAGREAGIQVAIGIFVAALVVLIVVAFMRRKKRS